MFAMLTYADAWGKCVGGGGGGGEGRGGGGGGGGGRSSCPAVGVYIFWWQILTWD